MKKNRIPAAVFLLFIVRILPGQESALEKLLADSSMLNSSVSLCILDLTTGETIIQHESGKSLIPASVLKIVTSSAALELLGPDYRFRTTIGYSGQVNKRAGRITGNLIITGGGDPALGSPYFPEYYKDFMRIWVDTIKSLGIRKIDGSVITDDSRYDYQPVPSKWLWEDTGNYYGAGAFGLSLFDNTLSIHFHTEGEGSVPEMLGISPAVAGFQLDNNLTSSGSSDKGYIFRSPYSNYGWVEGTIPVNRQDFILKGSISDPPLLIAKIISNMLDSAGIEVSGDPATVRTYSGSLSEEVKVISEVQSPPLRDIIRVLIHESVNLYAEHLLKELGRIFENRGTTASGIEVIYDFLIRAGLSVNGIFLEDGSGMSPLNAINSRSLTELLLYMKTQSRYSKEFYASLPEAGKEGTLKNYFKDQIFSSNLKAKSGSMTRVRSYAGYFSTISGREMVFAIIVNNYSGTSQLIVNGIEEILKETIINN